jgi:hypothetical protein
VQRSCSNAFRLKIADLTLVDTIEVNTNSLIYVRGESATARYGAHQLPDATIIASILIVSP